MTAFRAAVTLLALLGGAQLAAEDHVLCVAEDGVFHYAKNCVEQPGLAAPVEPARHPRKFLWISRDQRNGMIGIIPPGATEADRGTTVGMFALNTAISGPADADGTVVLTDAKLGTWTFTLEPWWFRDGRLNIQVPKGTWNLTITAAGKLLQKPVRVAFLNERGKSIFANRPPPADLPKRGRIVLRGQAQAKDGTAADFAQITSDCNRVVCETAADGKFRCELDRPPGNTVCIEHARLGRARLELEPGISMVDVGRVELVPGAVIRVIRPSHIELPEATVSLRRKGGEIGEPQRVDRREVVEFSGLDGGRYEILLAGPQPLQRKLFAIDVEASSQKELILSLDAYRLTGQVEYRDKPLGGATIELNGDAWRADLEADQSGRFNAELWSPGDYAVLVRAPLLAQPYGEMKRVSPSDSNWRFEIPSRHITGHITDADTGKPIADASILVESKSGETRWTRPVVADENGEFDVSGVGEGTYEIAARAPAYMAGDAVPLTISKSDGDRQLDFPLERGITIPLTVTDTNGEPVTGAIVAADFTPDGSSIKRLLRTDANGRVLVPTAEKSTRTVFIIPAKGSLALARVTSDAPDGTNVVVPDPVVALTLRALDSRGEGVMGVQYGLRYQGQILPRGLLLTLAVTRSFALATGTGGDVTIPLLPAGRYDVEWIPPAGTRPVSKLTSVEAAGGDTIASARFMPDSH
jgi:hypothetical protein